MSSVLLKYASLIIPIRWQTRGLRASDHRSRTLPADAKSCIVLASEFRPEKDSVLQNSSHHQSAGKSLGIFRRVVDTRVRPDARNLLRFVPGRMADRDPYGEFISVGVAMDDYGVPDLFSSESGDALADLH